MGSIVFRTDAGIQSGCRAGTGPSILPCSLFVARRPDRMKIARFSVEGWESYGLVEGDRVRVIQGDIFGEHKESRASYPLDRVKLLPPTRPTTFWAVGLNYAAHIAHQEGALDAERIKRESQGFRPWHKGAHCIIGQNDAVVIPADADYVHYEGELVIVIGRPARNVRPARA